MPLLAPWRAGDLITQRLLPGNLPHIAIATGQRTAQGEEIIIENIGGGAKVATPHSTAQLFGHYRLAPNGA